MLNTSTREDSLVVIVLDLCKVSDKLAIWQQLFTVLSSREYQFALIGAFFYSIDERLDPEQAQADSH